MKYFLYVFFFFNVVFISSLTHAQSPSPNCACAPNSVAMDQYPNISVPGYSLYYFRRSEPSFRIGAFNPDITLAVVVSHGAARNAQDYFCYMQNSVDAYFGANSSSVLVFAPWFAAQSDAPAPGQVFWPDSNDWRWCGLSSPNVSSPSRASSCAMLDSVLQDLASRATYPSLRAVVVTGHSAGGQIAQRYALGTPLAETLSAKGVSLRFVPNNPSSYAYLDASRPLPQPAAPTCADYCVSAEIPSLRWKFQPGVDPALFDCQKSYDEWGYGLVAKNEYMRQTSDEELVSRYPGRQVIYGLGSADVCDSAMGCGCDDEDLDVTCPAMAQGWCRFARGYAWFQYLAWFYQAPVHSMAVCPGVAHDGCAMLQCPIIQRAIFEGN